MTYEDALAIVEVCGLNVVEPSHSKVAELVFTALEKQIPKKVKTEGHRYWGEAKFGYCDCGCGINSTDNLYCNKCGQALDWSDTE